MIDLAFWGLAVLIGLLAATISSALASFVGSTRILEALGSHSIIPASGWFSKRTKKRAAPCNFFQRCNCHCGMLRELNAIAPLVAMIFLLTSVWPRIGKQTANDLSDIS